MTMIFNPRAIKFQSMIGISFKITPYTNQRAMPMLRRIGIVNETSFMRFVLIPLTIWGIKPTVVSIPANRPSMVQVSIDGATSVLDITFSFCREDHFVSTGIRIFE
jgi:hypothetical protein